MRGATTSLTEKYYGGQNFNSHTPCGVRPILSPKLKNTTQFQLTHPMRGATAPTSVDFAMTTAFQLTHPMRGATYGYQDATEAVAISTHTPHAGCDGGWGGPDGPAPVFQLTHPMRGATVKIPLTLGQNCHFNSHTPCGVRR